MAEPDKAAAGTPEEIAAGHRIDLTSVSPTSDTIDESDLEYHVSKNCKVIDYDVHHVRPYTERSLELFIGKTGHFSNPASNTHSSTQR